MSYWFALLALTILLALTVFQAALIFGAPLGKFAWGGASKYLSTRLRISSFISIILYLIFATFVTSKAGILTIISDEQVLTVGMWLFTVYFFIGIAMNAISRSKPERNLMTPLAALLAISFLVVALG